MSEVLLIFILKETTFIFLVNISYCLGFAQVFNHPNRFLNDEQSYISAENFIFLTIFKILLSNYEYFLKNVKYLFVSGLVSTF